ncbi:MAG: hypothetical protein OCD02_23880 [Spirochaetaceae bacterium]
MNFNLNNVNKKIVIFFSLVGFFLSFITGIISGYNFINLFLRSAFSGIIIGIIIIIANFVIMNFLPELVAGNESEDFDSSTANEGHVDIVMPEEGYTVQSDEQGDSDQEPTEIGADGEVVAKVDTGFKEVDLDNLKSLSSSGFNSSETSEEDDYASDKSTSLYSSMSGDNAIENNSVEDMARAVKTVLKKD